MIPVLYQKRASDFENNGIGRLIDAVSCKVVEERNGSYELTLQYPISGVWYSDIHEGNIIKAKANDDINKYQLFRIYKSSKPLKGIVTFYARHISYDLSGYPVKPFSIQHASAQLAVDTAFSNSLLPHPFIADIHILSNMDTPFAVTKPKSLRGILGGDEESILSTWDGEFEFDNFCVRFNEARGTDSGVIIRYGKNLTDAKQERSINDCYTHFFPYATIKAEDTEQVITLAGDGLIELIAPEDIGHSKAYTLDITDMFLEDEEINETNLRIHADEYIATHELGVPAVNITVSLLNVWNTPEYAHIAALEQCRLCDTITVYFEDLGINAKAKVIKTEYDSLLERFTKIEVGDVKNTLADTFSNIRESVRETQKSLSKEEKKTDTVLQSAIDEATKKITGNSGGYVVHFPPNYPEEILIMDTPDKSTAKRMWRWNSAGLGYSSDGYDGPYGTAITMDGEIVADYITAGTLNAINVKGCSIEGGTININNKFIVDELGNATIRSCGGGRNYILNSNQSDTLSTETKSYTLSDALVVGETYTISLSYAAMSEFSSFYFKVGNQTVPLADTGKSGKQVVTQTFTVTNSANNSKSASIGRMGGSSIIYWVKLERGGIATDWSPAPEEAINSIAEIKTQADADRAAVDIVVQWREEAISSIAEIRAQADADRTAMDIVVQWQENFQIGGRNLILGTAIPLTLDAGSNEDKYQKITPTIPLKKGQTYSFSADVTAFDTGKDREIAIGVFNDSLSEGNIVHLPIAVDSEGGDYYSGHISGTITISNTSSPACVLIYAGLNGETSTNIIKFSSIKFEEGNTPTAWTPAPEDAINAIASIKATADANSAFVGMFAQYGDSAGEMCIKAINGESAAKISADRIDLAGKELNVKVDAANIFGTFSVETKNGARVNFGELVNGLGVESKDFDASSAGNAVRIFPKSITYEEDGSGTVAILFDMSGHTLNGNWYISNLGSSTPVTSDATKKNSITIQPEVYSRIFDRLSAVIFKYNNGTSDRIHTGLIAQDLEKAVLAEGLTSQDFAAVCYDIDENGHKTNYGIRYEELVSMCIYEIQKLKARISELQGGT